MCQVLSDDHFLLVIKALNQRKDKRHPYGINLKVMNVVQK